MPFTRVETARLILERDGAFGAIIEEVGPPPRRRATPVAGRFAELCESVTHQLLATKAARTIHARVLTGCRGQVTPHSLSTLGESGLRKCGLSRTKALALLDIAAASCDGRVQFANHGYMSDADVAAEVTSLYGVGPWTAQMYLMFTLARPDVWAPGDLGVRHGWSIIHQLDERIDERELRRRGDTFAGLRSAVSWYCWRAADLSRH